MSELTAAEKKAIEAYKLIRDALRVPFPKDLQDTNGKFPDDRKWITPALDKYALQDLLGSNSGTQDTPAQSASQGQGTQPAKKSAQTTTASGSAKQSGGK